MVTIIELGLQTGDSNEAITRQNLEMRIGQNNARWK
jgi:hypothetical protein